MVVHFLSGIFTCVTRLFSITGATWACGACPSHKLWCNCMMGHAIAQRFPDHKLLRCRLLLGLQLPPVSSAVSYRCAAIAAGSS